jgi:hypothetical protein
MTGYLLELPQATREEFGFAKMQRAESLGPVCDVHLAGEPLHLSLRT